MNRQEAIERLDLYKTINDSADDQRSLSYLSDVQPYIRLADELGIVSDAEFQRIIEKLKNIKPYQMKWRDLDELQNYMADKINKIF